MKSAAHRYGGRYMDDDYGNDYITITDDDGNEFELEHLATAEIGGNLYMAFLPADMDEDDEDFGVVILRVDVERDEEILVTIDDENELNMAYEYFIERLSDEQE